MAYSYVHTMDHLYTIGWRHFWYRAPSTGRIWASVATDLTESASNIETVQYPTSERVYAMGTKSRKQKSIHWPVKLVVAAASSGHRNRFQSIWRVWKSWKTRKKARDVEEPW